MGSESWVSPSSIGLLLAFDHGAADSMRFAERQREKRSRRERLRLCLSAGMLYCLGAVAQGEYGQTPAGLPSFDDITTGWLSCSGAYAGGKDPTRDHAEVQPFETVAAVARRHIL